MSKEEPYRDQAERLRQRIEKVPEMTSENMGSLPPRSDLHRQRKKKTKVKVKYPLIRLLVLFFILLPITIYTIYSYLDAKNTGGSEKTTVSPSEYETINIDNP